MTRKNRCLLCTKLLPPYSCSRSDLYSQRFAPQTACLRERDIRRCILQRERERDKGKESPLLDPLKGVVGDQKSNFIAFEGRLWPKLGVRRKLEPNCSSTASLKNGVGNPTPPGTHVRRIEHIAHFKPLVIISCPSFALFAPSIRRCLFQDT